MGTFVALGAGLLFALLSAGLGWKVLKAAPWELTANGKAGRLLASIGVAFGIFVAMGSYFWVPKAFPPAGESAVWLDDLQVGFETSARTGKPLLVDGGAVWCASCERLKRETLPDPQVVRELGSYVPVALDMDLPKNQYIWDQYQIKGLPWVAVFAPGETQTPAWVIQDFEAAPEFSARLEKGLSGGDQDSLAGWLATQGLFVTLLLVYLAGLAASLTPCAYPSYFLIFGFFAGSSAEDKPKLSASLAMASTIVLGMVLSYVAAGLAAALGGGAVGSLMSNPWVMGAIALLFAAMGASSLGILPPMEFAALKGLLQSKQKANYLWALVFGLVMGLIVAPCVGPILIGILTYIASTRDMALGVTLMATFALGMGTLFFAMALFSQTIRSKVRFGAWNEAITLAFGILFLVAALYYLKGILPFEAMFGVFTI